MPVSLVDELVQILLAESDLSPEEIFKRLESSSSGVTGQDDVRTVLLIHGDRFIESSSGRYSAAKRPLIMADSPDDSSRAWQHLENDLRAQLRGRRIVSEIGLDAKLLASVEDALSQVLRNDTDPLVAADRARALVAVLLVSHGIYRYEAGDYWSGFSIPRINQSYGKAFARAVHLLGLETFEDMVANDNATRYVAPILAHGGVPKYCLDDLLRLVSHGLRSGAEDATDLMTLWRTRRSAFAGIDKPVRRFLLYGGDLSRDFLDRYIDVIQEWNRSATLPPPAEAGLPVYVLSSLRRLMKAGTFDGDVLNPQRARSRIARPMLVCDPWDGVGPCVVLPRVGKINSSDVWTISTSTGIEREPASVSAEKSLPVGPSRQWEAELSSNGAVVSKATFEGLDSMPALFFDPVTHTHIAPGMGLRGDQVMVLHKADKAVQVIRNGKSEDPAVIDHLPEPTGEWSGFHFELISLAGCTALTVGNHETQRRISVSPMTRPSLRGNVLEDTTSTDGAPVVTANPGIFLPASPVPWTIKLTIGDTSTVIEQIGDSEVDLDELLPAHAASVAVNVRGVLGSDLRTTFTWIPGLTVATSTRLALPGGPPPTVSIDSPNLQPIGIEETMPMTCQPEPNADSVDLYFPGNREAIGVRIQLPRLRWGLIRAGRSKIDSAEIRLTSLDFEDANPPGIAVSIGRREVRFELQISSQSAELQRSPAMHSSGPRGLCIFDLGRFGDTLRGLDQLITITLLVGSAKVPVRLGTIRPEVVFSDVTIGSLHTGAESMLEVRFKQQRKVKERAVHLWPVGRPWDPPTIAEIPDDAGETAEILLSPTPPPGEYLAEVAINDKWVEPERPQATGPGVVQFFSVSPPKRLRT